MATANCPPATVEPKTSFFSFSREIRQIIYKDYFGLISGFYAPYVHLFLKVAEKGQFLPIGGVSTQSILRG